MRTTVLAAGNNFLVPNWTFVAELISFLIILFVLWRYVVPPVQKAMRDRQQMIEKQVEESREAAEKLQEAERKYREMLAEARTEAAKIRDAARNDALALRDEMRKEADREVARIRQHGEGQLAHQREQIVQELRGELGELAVTLAGRVVGESLADEARQSRIVDRFLDELDELPTKGAESTSVDQES
jgi:F-type H+-transporting ATPase subunit b